MRKIADGKIEIDIIIDGKQIGVASKELDKLEESGLKSGKGIKAAESSMDSLGDKSAKAGSSVKSAGSAIEDLGDSGAKAGKGLKGADGAIDSLADSSAGASSSVKGAKDAIDGLGDSGSKAEKGLKGADSAIDGIADSSAGASSSVKGVSDSLDGMSDKAGEAAESARKVKEETDGVGQQSSKATIGIKNLATSLGLVAIASAAFDVLKSSVDGAISRFDTLNTFPKVLQALGVSAEDSQKAMESLSEGIDGLPTTLDDIAGSAQQMYNSFKDIDETTDTALALNNALLASGSAGEKAKRGTDQYIKALQTGQFNMDTWNTLQETMGIGLTKLAGAFGFVGKSAENDLYKALQSGSITFDQFNNKLIELGTGTGELAKLAKVNSLGIATSLGNLKNAAARGIANIIESFDKLSEKVTGNNIAENIDSLKVVVNSSFKVIGSVIEGTTPIIILFADGVNAAIPVVQALTPALIGAATAYTGLLIVSKVSTAIKASNAALLIATASQEALTLATKASMVAQIEGTAVKKADAVATAAQTGVITLSSLAIGVMTGKLKLAEAATIAYAAAKKLLMGPVGWVTLGIGALAGAVVGLVKWFNKASEETKRMNDETDKLSGSVDNLSSSIEENADAHKEALGDIDATRKKNEDLMRTVEELAGKENKSAAEKQILAGYINELNDSVDGLSLSYNEEANALNMSSEELGKRIQLMAEQERFTEAMERQVEIAKEQHEVDSKLDEITAKRQEWKDAVAEGTTTASAAAEKIAVLQEEEDKLKGTNEELAAEHDRTMKIIAEATENGVNISADALEEWIGKNKELLGSMNETYNEILDITTNAFSKMSGESKATGEEMIKNLRHNQQMTADWSKNISELYEYASKNGHEGFLHWLEKLGPDSAAEIAEIKGMSDTELKEFAGLMDNGASAAADDFKTSLGKGMGEAFDAVSDIITSSPKTLRESIKSAGFDEIGVAIPEGLETGVNKGKPKVEKATADMATAAVDSSKGILRINSPSKVFKEMGAAPVGRSTEKTKENSIKGAYLMRSLLRKEAVMVS